MADSFTVQTHGVAELRRALRKLNPELDKQLALKLLGVAQAIVPIAQSMMPHRSGWAAGTLKARVVLRGAQITAGTGNPSEDYVPWLIFGGSTGIGHARGPNMGAIHRDWMGRPTGQGRYVAPAIASKRADTLEAIDAAIAEAAIATGFETEGHI